MSFHLRTYAEHIERSRSFYRSLIACAEQNLRMFRRRARLMRGKIVFCGEIQMFREALQGMLTASRTLRKLRRGLEAEIASIRRVYRLHA